MSLTRDEVRKVSKQEGTEGGTTYHVILKGDKNPRALCWRPIHGSNGLKHCARVAGFGTEHVGVGACKLHGGNNLVSTNLKNGRTAKISRLMLATKVEDYLNKDRGELLDLTYELAVSRALFDEFMEDYPKPDDERYGVMFNRFNTIINTIAGLAEKISKADTRNTLTAAQVLYLRATVADILMKYILDPADRDRAARELASRMGGDVEVEMRPSEFRAPRLNG